MDDSRLPIKRLIDFNTSVGELSTLGEPCEPFGELSFYKMIDVFYDKAYALDEEGCEIFLIEGMDSLAEIRAAVFACRRLEKPIMVMLEVKDEDHDSLGGRELAFLISLQEMGVSAFGIKPSQDCPQEEIELLYKQLYPYATIPFFARLRAGKVIYSEIRRLMSLGVECFDCREITGAELDVLKIELSRGNFTSMLSLKEDISFIAANEQQAFFLNPENVTVSPQIDIECDMADELVDFDDESYDIISVLVSTHDDGFRFSQNVHYIDLPIMFSAGDTETLEMALQYYHGRAIVDSQCGIDRKELKELAKKYGAIVY